MAAAAAVYPPLNQRPLKNTIVLFDVDDTLTIPRNVGDRINCLSNPTTSYHDSKLTSPQRVTPEMLQILSQLRHKVAIGYVGGSDMVKQQEQLGSDEVPVTALFDYCFPENGLSAYRLGVPLASASFIGWIGEEKYKRLVKYILRYISELDLPVMRGTFVEFRNGMINVSPVGRNASQSERQAFTAYDDENGIRVAFVKALKKEFPDLGLTYVLANPSSRTFTNHICLIK
jgi:phosphomannomutase